MELKLKEEAEKAAAEAAAAKGGKKSVAKKGNESVTSAVEASVEDN